MLVSAGFLSRGVEVFICLCIMTIQYPSCIVAFRLGKTFPTPRTMAIVSHQLQPLVDSIVEVTLSNFTVRSKCCFWVNNVSAMSSGTPSFNQASVTIPSRPCIWCRLAYFDTFACTLLHLMQCPDEARRFWVLACDIFHCQWTTRTPLRPRTIGEGQATTPSLPEDTGLSVVMA